MSYFGKLYKAVNNDESEGRAIGAIFLIIISWFTIIIVVLTVIGALIKYAGWFGLGFVLGVALVVFYRAYKVVTKGL